MQFGGREKHFVGNGFGYARNSTFLQFLCLYLVDGTIPWQADGSLVPLWKSPGIRREIVYRDWRMRGPSRHESA